MARNLQEELLRQKQATDALLASQRAGIPGGIAGRRAELEGVRNKFFGRTSPTVGGVLGRLGMAQTNNADVRSRLAQEAERRFATDQFGANRDLISRGYQLAGSRQQSAQSDVNDLNAFVRQFANTERANAFQADEAQRDREAALQREAAADAYARQGVIMQEQNLPQMDYEAALMRALFGLGTSAATGYIIGRQPNQSVPMTSERLNQYYPAGGFGDQSLRERTGFSPFTRRY